MQGDATVLLVSVGEPPEALRLELERLGVRVVVAAFPQAEESIETESPDLIVLGGALGSMELATLLEDQEGEHPPRMVIVAARKDLAKLRGLNREIVISLFALETTEKVVAQRVESLARRAARRRRAEEPEQTNLKKTALGLPTGAAKVQPNSKTEAEPEKPQPSAPDPFKGTAIGAMAGARVPRATVSRAPVAGSPADPTIGKSARLEEDTGEAELVSLRPSEFVEEPDGGPESKEPAIPRPDSIPDFTDAALSAPPTLPPEAKVEGLSSTAILGAGVEHGAEGLDISAAENALENLDSVKLELDDDLKKSMLGVDGPADIDPHEEKTVVTRVPHGAGEDIGDRLTPHVPLDAVDHLHPPSDNVDDAPGSALSPAPGEQPETVSGPSQHAAEGFAQTQLGYVPDFETHRREASTSTELSPETSGGEQQNSETQTSPERSPRSAAPFASESLPKQFSAPETPGDDEDLVLPLGRSHPPKKKGGGAVAIGLLVVAAVAIGGAAWSGVFGTASSAATKAPISAENQAAENQVRDKLPSSTQPATSKKEGPPSAAQDPTTASLQPSEAKSVEGKPADAAQEEAPPADASDNAETTAEVASTGAMIPLKNPFRIEDANAPSCKTILGSDVPTPGGDPVHEASVVWNEARAAIVAGKLDTAHKRMCEAVSLNPQSAAVEGLATLYLQMESTALALEWLDRAEKQSPGKTELGNLRGDIYSQMGRNDEARAIWLRMLAIKPEETRRIEAISKDYSVEAGRYLRRGDLVRAAIWFRRAVTLDPQNLAAIVGLANTFYRDERRQHARSFALLALEVSDVIPEVHVLLGELALESGDKSQAKARFERALAVRPDFYPAKRGLALVREP